MKNIYKTFFFAMTFLITFYCGQKATANNLQIGVPSISGNQVTFTIQWDNSWRLTTGPANWDAVWVFVKYQTCTDNLWKHVDLSAAGHSVTGGVLQVQTVSDNKGVFINRIAAGNGNISSATVTLTMSFADATYNYQVFGIEMINIPQGDFYIGDGTRGTSTYGFSGPNPYPAKLIDNNIQNVTGLGTATNYQWNGWGSSAVLPTAFPLGWNRFYCMKYEISQEQFSTFLNALSYDQQVSRTANSPNSAVGTLAIAAATNCRNGIRIQTTGTLNNIPAVYGCDLNNNGTFNEAADGQNLACNFLKWSDLTAYLDWSALRPMTEFEFEKACRGPNSALAYEYAWGTTDLLQAESGALNNAGATNETSTASGSGLCAYGINNTAKGPLRCGFTATGSTNRVQAGGSYYGVIDMSGNVAEQCIGGYNFNFSSFTNISGDGDLSTAGNANTANWPSNGGGQAGALMRGGDWYTNTVAYLDVSDRYFMVDNSNQLRDRRIGGRGVRTY